MVRVKHRHLTTHRGSPAPASSSPPKFAENDSEAVNSSEEEQEPEQELRRRLQPTRRRSSVVRANLLYDENGTVRLDAPGTPFDDIDLSDTFLKHEPEPVKKSRGHRRLFFLGGLIGAFLAWFFTAAPPLGDFDHIFENVDIPSWPEMVDLVGIKDLSKSINLTEFFEPSRQWLQSRDFQVGRDAKARGLDKHHAIVLIPGIISTGLESWSTEEDQMHLFRKRLWGTTTMIRQVIVGKKEWLKAMSLDPETGLDPPDAKIRSAQGLDAASYFITGYWIWSKIIENLAVLGYDHTDMSLAAYDWRLSYTNLQTRDNYYSRLKYQIEHTKAIYGKKTVIASHSMGSSVMMYFLKWVESPIGGNGGPNWCEEHIASFVNIAGTLLGVPKAMAAILSGEMRDTVELNPAATAALEQFFSRKERTELFRSWPGASSMLVKGGTDVWGDEFGAPDDPIGTNNTNGIFFHLSQYEHDNDEPQKSNLSIVDAMNYVTERTPSSYQKMLATNWSFGLERDPEQIKLNDNDPTKWTNPLEVRLPNAPSMKIFCLYGHGKPTERGYWYAEGPPESDEERIAQVPTCDAEECSNVTHHDSKIPYTRPSWIDNSVNIDNYYPPVKSGVVSGEGDGTVSLLSLGAMCAEGWKHDLYNPAKIPVVTHELKHEPAAFDPRGGPTTGDHVDILGSTRLNDIVLNIVSGHEHEVQDNFVSNIREYSKKIKWN